MHYSGFSVNEADNYLFSLPALLSVTAAFVLMKLTGALEGQ